MSVFEGLTGDVSTVMDARFSRNLNLALTWVGDSITNNGGALDAVTATNTQAWYAKGFWWIADALTGHRCTMIFPGPSGPGSPSAGAAGIAFALGGLVTTDILGGGYMAAAVASPANIIGVHIGTNDVNAGTPAAAIMGNILAIWRMATTVGKKVIATTILPRDSTIITGAKLSALNAVNQLIRQNAAVEPNVYLCDWHASMLDSAGSAPGAGVSQWSQDGLHPNPAGGWRMGTALAATLGPLLAPRTPPDHLPINPADSLTPNPIAAGGTTSPTSWTLTNVGAPTSVTGSKIPRTDLLPGALHQVVAVAATANTDGFTITITDSTTTDWAAGDVVYGFAEIWGLAAGWDCRGMQLDVVKSGVATVASANMIASADRTALTTSLGPAPAGGIILVTPRVTLDPSLTAVRAVLRFYGSGTIQVGRMGVRKI
jgi:lysophospholipase L1-like esterase